VRFYTLDTHLTIIRIYIYDSYQVNSLEAFRT
jgi:hypothetical protein